MEASRFRIRFVFPVVHGFLLVVSQYCLLVALHPKNPLRTGRAQLKHPAPNQQLSPGIYSTPAHRNQVGDFARDGQRMSLQILKVVRPVQCGALMAAATHPSESKPPRRLLILH